MKYKCPICNKINDYDWNDDLRLHLFYEHSENEKTDLIMKLLENRKDTKK